MELKYRISGPGLWVASEKQFDGTHILRHRLGKVIDLVGWISSYLFSRLPLVVLPGLADCLVGIGSDPHEDPTDCGIRRICLKDSGP
jgi:hypothetical protein